MAYRALASYTILAHMNWIVETIQGLEGGELILQRVGERMPPSVETTFEATLSKPEFSIFATHGSK